jgi:hypothetical protein
MGAAGRDGVVKKPGFPEGPYGSYQPFTHPVSGEAFHARDTFDIRGLGYSFEELPKPLTRTDDDLTEMPTFAVFAAIDINKMDQSRNLHVFVVAKAAAESFAPPADIEQYHSCANYGGDGTIFGLFPPGGASAHQALASCRNGLYGVLGTAHTVRCRLPILQEPPAF